jgi:mono/diheme cytochrome c family protein
MPAYTAYTTDQYGALVALVASFPPVPGSRATWRPETGSRAAGAEVFARTCAGCHGPAGEGKLGPALANPGFQQAATPEYVAATVVRGRRGTPMPAFGRDNVNYPRLSAREIADVAAFVTGGLGPRPTAARGPSADGRP